MKLPFLTSLIAFFAAYHLMAQQPVRRLPGIINHPSINLFAPFMSMDGNAIVFISDNGREGEYSISYTSRETDWVAPVELPKHINTRLNFTRGYALSADGKRLYYTSAKSPVIGGYDIMISELKGNTWSTPVNMAMPINSKTNDGCPSVSADENTLYFMRCDRMTATKAEGCKIFRATKKPNGQWNEPEELPAHINTGNSQTPRIMADGETLIFSSDKFPGNKGGMDLYLTRLVDGQWQEPVAMDFINSEKDDQYVSVNALGRYLLTEAMGSRNNWELTEFLIPAHLRPKGMMKVEGTVKGAPAYISVRDIQSGKRVYSGRPAADGAYFFYLKEGSVYEVAFDPEDGQRTFLLKSYDLTGDKIAQRERVDVVIKTPDAGDELDLSGVAFEPYSSRLATVSQELLKRVARMIKANPNLGFEVQVLMAGYRESEANADPDLTENFVVVDSVDQYDVVTADSVTIVEEPDSVSTADEAESRSRKAVERVIYHNDRTQKQSEEIANYLIANGVAASQLTTMVNAIPSEEPALTVRLRVYRLK